MVWCSYCARDQEVEADDVNGFTYCTGCGRVLDDSVFSSEPTFTKGSDGSSQLQGNFVKERPYRSYGSDGHMYATASHEKTLEKGRNEINDIADYLAMGGRDDAVNAAHRLYIIAVERNFTKGRRTIQVAAACLYIICRQEQKPFLLIDFSDCLQISVYVLGAVFLQLCRLLSLEQHPIMQKPVDPSLFIHRFADRLLRRSSAHEKKFHPIANMALRLVASMKRDWMQTGRRPSGICGAALFISAHVHGFECTKTDVVSVVHICEGTLTKRLIEFENTESGSLTPEEFEERAKEYEVLLQTIQPPKVACKGDDKREVLCEHKDLGVEHFAVGLCKACYEEFIRVSGGLEGGAAPPAFQVAERKREEAEKQLQKQKAIEGSQHCDKQVEGEASADKVKSKQRSSSDSAEEIDALSSKKEVVETDRSKKDDDFQSSKADIDSSKSGVDDSEKLTENLKKSVFDDLEEADDEDTFSDIDDDEVNTYLHNEEEIRLKTLIWTEMNKEYLEEQQAKQEAIAASEAARAAILAAAGEDSVKLAAAAAAAVAELKKDRKRKRDEAKSRGPAETATEAARQMLQNKKLSSKVNYDALETLFDGEDASKKKSDVKDTNVIKEKHVSWADSDVTDIGGKNEQKDAKKISKESPEKDEDEDDDDVEEEGDDNNDDGEIDQISGYDYSYGGDDYADYGDDGYDEY